MSESKHFAGTFVVGLVAGCAPSGPVSVSTPIPELADRTAGPPQSCVPITPNAAMRIADRHHLIYSIGSTVWLSTTDCPVNSDDILVLHPTTSQYCRGDIVRTVSRVGQIPGPACVIGNFVPYRR
jgi:hypothetical protein